MKFLSSLIMLAFSLLFANVTFATASMSGIGGVAQSMMDPVGLFSDFIYVGCIVIGGSFVFASIVKYIEHRRSPLMVPISTVVFLFIAGTCLLLMPFLSYIYTNAIGFSLPK